MPQKNRLKKKLSGKSYKKSRTQLQRHERLSGGMFQGSVTVPAATAKNNFATILDEVIQGRDVVITKHNNPKAVVISIEKFGALTNASTLNLGALTSEFNTRLARMQTVEAKNAMQAAFDASPEELGRAALGAARSR